MKYYFWRKGNSKDVSNYTIVERAELLVKVNEEFVKVLREKMDKATTSYDERFLARMIRKDKYCRLWYEVMKATHPEVDFRIRYRRTMSGKQLISFLAWILIVGGVCALLHKAGNRVVPGKAVAKKEYHGFYRWRISSVIDSAQQLYNRKMVLDQPEIADVQCSGTLDPAMPFEDFLKYFTLINELEFYIDNKEVIHLKKSQTAGNIGR